MRFAPRSNELSEPIRVADGLLASCKLQPVLRNAGPAHPRAQARGWCKTCINSLQPMDQANPKASVTRGCAPRAHQSTLLGGTGTAAVSSSWGTNYFWQAKKPIVPKELFHCLPTTGLV